MVLTGTDSRCPIAVVEREIVLYREDDNNDDDAERVMNGGVDCARMGGRRFFWQSAIVVAFRANCSTAAAAIIGGVRKPVAAALGADGGAFPRRFLSRRPRGHSFLRSCPLMRAALDISSDSPRTCVLGPADSLHYFLSPVFRFKPPTFQSCCGSLRPIFVSGQLGRLLVP